MDLYKNIQKLFVATTFIGILGTCTNNNYPTLDQITEVKKYASSQKKSEFNFSEGDLDYKISTDAHFGGLQITMLNRNNATFFEFVDSCADGPGVSAHNKDNMLCKLDTISYNNSNEGINIRKVEYAQLNKNIKKIVDNEYNIAISVAEKHIK